MKIYRVEVNEVRASSIGPLTGRLIKEEYFLTKERSTNRVAEISDGMKKLIGLYPVIEVRIVEIEVIE